MLIAHALAVLAMAPFGYHAVPENGEIRMLTGQLFAVGVVYFLSLPLLMRQEGATEAPVRRRRSIQRNSPRNVEPR